MFPAYNFLLIGERRMDFMSYHLLKMKELREYRRTRRKANILGSIITVSLLVLCGLVIWLRFIGD